MALFPPTGRVFFLRTLQKKHVLFLKPTCQPPRPPGFPRWGAGYPSPMLKHREPIQRCFYMSCTYILACRFFSWQIFTKKKSALFFSFWGPKIFRPSGGIGILNYTYSCSPEQGEFNGTTCSPLGPILKKLFKFKKVESGFKSRRVPLGVPRRLN